MNAEDILQAYIDSCDEPRPFDAKHPEDGVLSRKADGLPPRPMNADETAAAVALAGKDPRALDLLLTEVENGTGKPAEIKASFLYDVAAGKRKTDALSADEAITFLEYMKGGWNVPALVRLLDNDETAQKAKDALSRTVLIHNAFDSVADRARNGNAAARELLESWARADWFEQRPAWEKETKVVVYKIPDDIEASTDFLSHSKGGHTRTDIPFHAKHYFMTREMYEELQSLKAASGDIPVALTAERIGTSSSRKSGMNNVEWNTGISNDDTRNQPNKRTRAIVFAGSVLGPIFAKTAEDMGSVILRVDTAVLKKGDVVTIDWAGGVLKNDKGDVVSSFERPDFDVLRAGGGTAFRMGRILTENARRELDFYPPLPFKTEKNEDVVRPMTAAQKVIAVAAGLKSVSAGQTVYARVGTVASQDTTGPMTVQELQGTLAAMKLAVPLFLQSQCHNAALAFRSPAVVAANDRLASFVRNIGGVALNMGDGIIHSWLNEMVVPDTVVVGGDSHTRVPTALSFPLGSGGVAEAAATGVTEITVPDSVLVVIDGEFKKGVTVRDLVNYLPYKALKLFGKNIFEGTIIEYRRSGKPFDMIDVFKLTNSSAERSAAAAYFEQDAETVAAYVKDSSLPVIDALIANGYDKNGVLAERRKALTDWLSRPVKAAADEGAVYKAVVHIDLNEIDQPYVACPHTPDNVKPLSELSGTPVGFGFIGSCMAGVRDFEAFERLLRGKKPVCPVRAAVPTKPAAKKLEEKGVLPSLRDSGVGIEESGCSLCMGNQERVAGAKNVLTTSTRNFKGRMGDDASVYLVSAELEAVAVLRGAFPTKEEYFKAVNDD